MENDNLNPQPEVVSSSESSKGTVKKKETQKSERLLKRMTVGVGMGVALVLMALAIARQPRGQKIPSKLKIDLDTNQEQGSLVLKGDIMDPDVAGVEESVDVLNELENQYRNLKDMYDSASTVSENSEIGILYAQAYQLSWLDVQTNDVMVAIYQYTMQKEQELAENPVEFEEMYQRSSEIFKKYKELQEMAKNSRNELESEIDRMERLGEVSAAVQNSNK